MYDRMLRSLAAFWRYLTFCNYRFGVASQKECLANQSSAVAAREANRKVVDAFGVEFEQLAAPIHTRAKAQAMVDCGNAAYGEYLGERATEWRPFRVVRGA